MGTDYKCYKCKKEGNYAGESEIYFTCPSCLYKIRLDRAVAYLQGKEWQKPKRQSSQRIEKNPQPPQAEIPHTPQIPVERKDPKVAFHYLLSELQQESESSNQIQGSQSGSKNLEENRKSEEGFHFTLLSSDSGSKICKEHNLPAAYNENKRKCMCQRCYSDSIEQSENYKKLEKERKVVPNNEEVVVIEKIKDEMEVRVVEFPMPLKDSRGNRLTE